MEAFENVKFLYLAQQLLKSLKKSKYCGYQNV